MRILGFCCVERGPAFVDVHSLAYVYIYIYIYVRIESACAPHTLPESIRALCFDTLRSQSFHLRYLGGPPTQ